MSTTPEEAIRSLTEHLEILQVIDLPIIYQATRLGVEALKRHKDRYIIKFSELMSPLLSETADPP